MSAVTLGIGAVAVALGSTILTGAGGSAMQAGDVKEGRWFARAGEITALLAVALGFWAGRASL
jgi:hypothetical protein